MINKKSHNIKKEPASKGKMLNSRDSMD